MLGIDRWGKEYASFSLPLCEKNAAAEGVKNISFQRGNAVKLDFPDESFDAVTSNYVYHNITGEDKQQLLLETLRVRAAFFGSANKSREEKRYEI